MQKIYFDATQPLRWGPHPPVGIPRVESALIRQVLRRNDFDAEFFLIEGDGTSRLLTISERRYLEGLVEQSVPSLDGMEDATYLARMRVVHRIIQVGGSASGKEFDRVAAAFLSQRPGRNGARYALAKLAVRIDKLLTRPESSPGLTGDPLADPKANCFVSNVGLHTMAAHRSKPIRANASAILHDMIPIAMPQYFNKSHTAAFERDLNWKLTRCASLICVSEFTARSARGLLESRAADGPVSSITVNPLGSFLREGLDVDSENSVQPLVDRSFAIYCSTIEIRKNHIVLLRAWLKLMPVLGDRLPDLVICGRWGWKVDEVRQFLADHPELLDKVHFLTGISDPQLAWLYKNARFGVFPSHVEGWGLGAAECLDFGLPVLISDAEALSEATQGLMPVIAAEDADGWCAAIERASTDDEWLATLRSAIADGYRPTSEAAFADRLLTLMGVATAHQEKNAELVRVL
ncbi:glycosyltransferase family 1 protein [Kaistia terrae]|uniref:Glycosyltransferase family 4 protein n=1 Tax=Kaistia terrae TaxID=537017 RepID=A0ABW0PRJ9_9HYPH|nr:glycosyltransferase family 1 protein [Kaistia terrae]MCX5578208.1 glycosyltransferase family 1 protein [Kaistia terrae]